MKPRYRLNKKLITSIKKNTAVENEPLERKIERMENNGEPLQSNSEAAQMIYTDRADGVQAAYDIRSDRFEIAVEATDALQKSNIARRDAAAKQDASDGGAEPIDGPSDK